MKTYDAIMMGGGVMGCATAYYLLKDDPTLNVAILEKDPTYEKSSTVLSDGNTRLQFNLKENILISKYGLEVLETFAQDMAVEGYTPEIAFRQEGNLFLTDEANKAATLEGMALQQTLGAQVEWMSPEAISQRWSFIDPATIAGGTYGRQDGTMDPQAVLLGYKNKAVELGADYITGEVARIVVENGRVQGVKLADGTVYPCRYAVNSAGAWGTALARTAGVELPVEPVMRQVFHLETTVTPENTVPMVVFPSGLYLIHENGAHFTAGKSLENDPIGFDFTFRKQLFIDHLWEDLVSYCPAFENLKVAGGWAGLYDVNTFDGNAILGESPQVKGLLLANGFSGHGFQQCHAVGRYLAEIIRGVDHALDLSIFSPQRILDNAPVFENPHKIV